MARRIDRANMGWPLLAASALCLLVALIEYFMPENGVDGTLGALISSLDGADARRRGGRLARYARKTLMVLILLDILGTGFAAYMLEANVLVGFIALASIAWLIGYSPAAGARARSAQAMP